MVLQDALVTLPHERYGEYLEIVYSKMAAHVPPDSNVVEVGARHDRGAISKRLIPHKTFVAADRNRRRGDITVDVLEDHLYADVILSTCVLHHTKEQDIPKVLEHLHAPILMFSGPNVEVLPELFGDHQWHIDVTKLIVWLKGYEVSWERIGISEPFCEVMVIAKC